MSNIVLYKNKLKDWIKCFIFYDVYEFIEKHCKNVMNIYHVIKNSYFPLKLIKVYYYDENNEKVDVTRDFCMKQEFNKMYENKLIHVEWSFKDREYAYYYDTNDETHIEFPPYTIEELKSKNTNLKIAAVTVDDLDDIDEVFDTVKKYAGPKDDFYGDLTADMSKVLNIKVNSTTIIDNKGKLYEFDNFVNLN